MAERWLVASGNIATPANLNGGTALDPGDTLHANGFTGSIEANITLVQVTNTAGATAVAGGGFTLSAGVTLTANVLAGPTNCVVIDHTGVNTITGTCTGGTVFSSDGVYLINNSTLTVNGDCLGGSADKAGGLHMETTASTAVVTVNGDCIGGTAEGYGVRFSPRNGYAYLTVNGNAIGGNVVDGITVTSGISMASQSIGRIRITGNAVGRAGPGVNWVTQGRLTSGYEAFPLPHTLIIEGNATGGSNGASQGIASGVRYNFTSGTASRRSEGVLIVNGNCIGGTASNCCGVLIHGSDGIDPVEPHVMKVYVRGNCQAGDAINADGLRSNGSAFIFIRGQLLIPSSNPNPFFSVNADSRGQAYRHHGKSSVVIGALADQLFPGELSASYYVHGAKVVSKQVAWTWVKNSVAVTTAGPTIDIKDFAGVSLIGGPQVASINADTREHTYDHPTAVMQRGQIYWLVFVATIDAEVREVRIPYQL